MKYFVLYKTKTIEPIAIIGRGHDNPIIIYECDDRKTLKDYLKILSEQQADIMKIIEEE